VRITQAELAQLPPESLPHRLAAALTDPHDPIALTLATSGSTGPAKEVLLPQASLLAAAAASHERLGGPGNWLACLPLTHIGGIQVLVRAFAAGLSATVLPSGNFTAEKFQTTARVFLHREGRRYTSVVPTQLTRLLAAGPQILDLLRQFDAILCGGGPSQPGLITAAKTAGINLIDSYGMTETSGGVIYHGQPLPGVEIALDRDGRIEIGGSVIAQGYTSSSVSFFRRGNQPWFRSNDLGRFDSGRLIVLGRADDVLISGGEKVHPQAVEQLLSGLPGIEAAVVVGIPDDHWGERIEALVIGDPPELPEIRRDVIAQLGPAAAPRAVHKVTEFPLRGPGKVDRQAALEIARQRPRLTTNSRRG
jgi:o-succinylbenzoate---CoA ligase